MASNVIDFNDLEIAFSHMDDKDLKRADFIFSLINSPIFYRVGTGLARLGLALHLPVTGLIRKSVFNHFCGGISIDDCEKTVKILNEFNVGTILDYSVEGEDSEADFDNTRDEILKIIKAAADSDAIPFSVFKMTGMASSGILERVAAGKLRGMEDERAFQRIHDRTLEVCEAAASVGLPIMIDAEETWIQDPIDDLSIEMMRRFNKDRIIVYNTYQMYRVDSLHRLMEHHRTLRQEGIKMGAKLVRGAYMEKERERAEEKAYASPIHNTKNDTDKCFDDGLRYCADHFEDISVMCGSHNEESNLLLAHLMDEKGIEHHHPNFWFAQLFGMSDNISFNLARGGYNVTKYVPYGPVRSVMPYLLRRADENTSVGGQSSRELTMIRKERERRKGARS